MWEDSVVATNAARRAVIVSGARTPFVRAFTDYTRMDSIDLAAAPLALGKPKPKDYLSAVAQLAPFTDILPKRPKIAERTTGEVMGESAEKMARIHRITRAAQDEFAARSHHRAAAAIESGRFDN